MPTDLFFTRRSVRQFNGEPVTDEQIHYMLRAAMYAPTAMNSQNWEFYVVKQGPKMMGLAEVWAGVLPKPKNDEEKTAIAIRSATLEKAAAAILVCGNEEKSVINGRNIGWATNCAAATQNILLAAHELGLGGVWLGVNGVEERVNAIKSFFNLPAAHGPFAICAIGHAKTTPPTPQERYDADKVHFIE
jgi:nitroreductase